MSLQLVDTIFNTAFFLFWRFWVLFSFFVSERVLWYELFLLNFHSIIIVKTFLLVFHVHIRVMLLVRGIFIFRFRWWIIRMVLLHGLYFYQMTFFFFHPLIWTIDKPFPYHLALLLCLFLLRFKLSDETISTYFFF